MPGADQVNNHPQAGSSVSHKEDFEYRAPLTPHLARRDSIAARTASPTVPLQRCTLHEGLVDWTMTCYLCGMRNYEELRSWKEAHKLTLAIYEATHRFPSDERYGLTSQIRRASVSVGSNIAEGSGRDSNADFGRFLAMAIGSASEVEYQLRLAFDLNYLDESQYAPLRDKADHVRRSLYLLRSSVHI